MKEFFSDITDNLINKEDVSGLLEYFEVLEDFNVPIGYYSNAVYGSKDSIALKKGDIIGMGSMRYVDTDKKLKFTNLCFTKKDRYPTSMSKEFFNINPSLFRDMTKVFIRDNKLNKILNQ